LARVTHPGAMLRCSELAIPPGVAHEQMRRRFVGAFGAALPAPRFVAEAERVALPVRVMLGDEDRNAVLDQRLQKQQIGAGPSGPPHVWG
jgi:hypothetical protein